MDAMTQPPVIRLHPEDDVVIARQVLPPGTPVGGNVATAARIPAGHKIAVTAHAKGEPVRRYGQIIGFATDAIAPGAWVHTHNLGMGDFSRDYAFGRDAKPTEPVATPATFQGIIRADGRVATRNYIGIMTSVNCSAHVAELIALAFRRNPLTGEDPLARLAERRRRGGADPQDRLRHDAQGEPLTLLRRTLGGFARHANFSHVIAIGLGCEVNQIGGLLDEQRLSGRAPQHGHPGDGRHPQDRRRRHRASCRRCWTRPTRSRREPVPASELCVGAAMRRLATAIPASPPTRRWARRSTWWCGTAAPRSCRRRPRSTAPSTC